MLPHWDRSCRSNFLPGNNSQQNSCETHASAPQTWCTTKSSEETETKEVARTRWHNQWDAYPHRQCSSVQTPADLQPQLGSRGASTDMARSNHDPHSEEREGPKEGANSYRPVNLTSSVVKTMERIVNECLKWYLETENLLAPGQARFRQFRSTEDQATYLSQEIEDAFQERKLVLVSWIDLQKAFDKVWMEGLLVKLLRNGIASNMFNWIKILPLQPQGKSLCRQNSQQENTTKALCSTGRSPIPYISPAVHQWLRLRASKGRQSSIICRWLGDLVQGRICNYSYIQDAVGGWQAQQLDREMVCCSQQGQIFHHLVHPVPKAKSRHHHSWWDPTEGGWRSNIPWYHIWQEADLETAHCQGISKSQTQDGYSSQTCGYHLGSKWENT